MSISTYLKFISNLQFFYRKFHHRVKLINFNLLFILLLNLFITFSFVENKFFLDESQNIKSELFDQLLNKLEETNNMQNSSGATNEIKENEMKKKLKSIRLENIMENNSYFEEFSIPMAKYFLKLSAYSYCSEEDIHGGNCCQELFTDDKWELFSHRKVSYDDYNYAILISNQFKKIVVSFPGTRGPAQLVKELYYSNGVVFTDDKSEKIMNYLKNVYLLFKSDLEKDLEECFVKYGNYQFIFTGHSLGGNMASISLLNSVKYGNLKTFPNSPMLITYGQSRVGNDVFANELMKYIPIIYRITRVGDIVSNIPFCAWTLKDKLEIFCKSVLPEGKFDKKFSLDDGKRKEAESNFYAWHSGGWMHFSDDMKTFEECGNLFGENFTNPKCQLTLNIDISKHVEYFGNKVSSICGK